MTFEKAPLAANSFDAITLWDVLEHMADPIAVLKKAARLLRPGGILALNVPNIESLIAKLMGSRWPLLLTEHLYYFSPSSLRLLLERSGFSVAGFHLHPVYFSVGYLLHRLAQHPLPGAQLAANLACRLALQNCTVPLLMGEVTVVAYRHLEVRGKR